MFIRQRIRCEAARQPGVLLGGKTRLQRRRDPVRDVVLKRQQVRARDVEILSPDRHTILHADELRARAQPIACRLQCPKNKIVRRQLVTDLLQIAFTIFVSQNRRRRTNANGIEIR